MEISESCISNIFPNAVDGVIRSILSIGINDADLTNTRRLSCFIAQTASNTGGFRWLREMGGRMYFSRYEMRTDLGNNERGDGYKYRGGGLLMRFVGKKNYKLCGDDIGINLVENPNATSDPVIAVKTACWLWSKNNCNVYCDKGQFHDLSMQINGTLNNLDDRLSILKDIESVFYD